MLGLGVDEVKSIPMTTVLSPQSLELETVMKPLSPHPVPHQFFMIQLLEESYPISSTAWLMYSEALLGQPEYIPVEQAEKPVSAQIPTISGPESVRSCFSWAVVSVSYNLVVPLPRQILLVSVQMPGVLGGKPELMLPAVQGQLLRSTPPTKARQSIASVIYPAVQLLGLFPTAQRYVHSSDACSESPRLQPFMSSQDSQVAMEEKAQQHPQLPWFLMEVTQPRVLQFREDGGVAETTGGEDTVWELVFLDVDVLLREERSTKLRLSYSWQMQAYSGVLFQ